jgi:hypothetical protein
LNRFSDKATARSGGLNYFERFPVDTRAVTFMPPKREAGELFIRCTHRFASIETMFMRVHPKLSLGEEMIRTCGSQHALLYGSSFAGLIFAQNASQGMDGIFFADYQYVVVTGGFARIKNYL